MSVQPAPRVAAPPLVLWTEADIAHVRATVAPLASDEEFKLLIYMANKYHLDPLLKQIWCIKYGNKPAQIFAGRDGFLAIAHHSGLFDGLETTVRIEPVSWQMTVTGRDGNSSYGRDSQYVATTHAYIRGAGHPVTVEVWEEEYSTGRDLWRNKPRTMITKVAECQALRKAFDISGLYDPDEMGTATQPPAELAAAAEPPALPEPAPAVPLRVVERPPVAIVVADGPATNPASEVAFAELGGPHITAAQDRAMRALFRALGWTDAEVTTWLQDEFHAAALGALSTTDAAKAITVLQQNLAHRQPAGRAR